MPSAPRRFRWHHLYYALAGFDLLTILATLVLSHTIMGIFTASVEVNQTWAERLAQYGVLRNFAAESNAPGNEVFASGNVKEAKEDLEGSVIKFRSQLYEQRAELQANVDADLAAPLLRDLAAVEMHFKDMEEEARRIFTEFDLEQPELAGRHMNAMDLRFYDVIEALHSLESEVRSIQMEQFQAQSAKATSLRKYEQAIALVVVLILIAVTIYGHTVSKNFARAEEKIYRQVKELRESQSALEFARNTAEIASAAKSQFLANMSHEIRTPMTSILGYAENCLDPDLEDEERLAGIQTILRNGDHLMQLINDILDLSKIEAGQMQLERIPTSVFDLLVEVRGLLGQQAEKKGIELVFDYEGAVPRLVETDPTRLKQAILNLVGNAIKFTEAGEVRVSTRLIELDAEGNLLEITVRDTGIGIEEEQLQALFSPFSQADESMTRRFGGTGLGLTISRRICRDLGGDLRVESRVGAGSTFTVTVGAGNVEDTLLTQGDIEAFQQSNDLENIQQQKLQIRVLLAEDGPDNQELISFILKRSGAEVFVVDNGRDAVERALESQSNGCPFDVILMDMQMPVLDGYRATRELRNHGYLGPIIALTAHAMSEERENCIRAGCDEFASKPIDRKLLFQTIQRCLALGDNTNQPKLP